LGTARDNGEDMSRKGRARPPKGEESPKAKLTSEQVREIRQLYARGVSTYEIGRRFNQNANTIWGAAVGRTWKVAGEPPSRHGHPKGSAHHLAVLDEDDLREIRRAYLEGVPQCQL